MGTGFGLVGHDGAMTEGEGKSGWLKTVTSCTPGSASDVRLCITLIEATSIGPGVFLVFDKERFPAIISGVG